MNVYIQETAWGYMFEVILSINNYNYLYIISLHEMKTLIYLLLFSIFRVNKVLSYRELEPLT